MYKISENDKEGLPIDFRKDADSIATNCLLTSHITDWDMERLPNESAKDEKKTPY